MSGTSLDGLDMAASEYWLKDGKWGFHFLAGKTVPYDQLLKKKLDVAMEMPALELALLDIELGRWFGAQVMAFIEQEAIHPELIASHGHTVFHQPDKGLTLQIGTGYEITRLTGVKTVADFRSKDVSLGGQGAPLVPIGDDLLFSEYNYCLNLGGIANISFMEKEERVAFDICPCNSILNFLAGKLGFEYDEDGHLAKQGQLNRQLLEKLNAQAYYAQKPPKSLGYEWTKANILPLLDPAEDQRDLLRTAVEHIADQITACLPGSSYKARLLVTGGGAFNRFLLDRIKDKLPDSVELWVPEHDVITYKEAIVFGFLGILRLRNETNCLSSVTGASADSCGGLVY